MNARAAFCAVRYAAASLGGKLLGAIFAAVLIVFSAPAISEATIGVGVASGKIRVQQELFPGGIYTLPAVPVLNTGDETSDYAMNIEYLQDQPEKRPAENWFSFSPETFNLAPSKAQNVRITLTVPVNAPPGDYFAYIEAHPVVTHTDGGVAHVNIAAASKLYFTVAPANILSALYYRVSSFLTRTAPWSYIVLGLILLVVCLRVLRRFIRLDIGISLKRTDAPASPDVTPEATLPKPAPKKASRKTKNASVPEDE